jgi:hypothetical protein
LAVNQSCIDESSEEFEDGIIRRKKNIGIWRMFECMKGWKPKVVFFWMTILKQIDSQILMSRFCLILWHFFTNFKASQND